MRYNLQLWGSIARRIQGQLPCHVGSLLGVCPQRFIARCDGPGRPDKINKFPQRADLYFFFRPFVWAEIDALYGEQERTSSACSALWRSQSSKDVWHTIHFLEDLELIVSLIQLLLSVRSSVRRRESMNASCCLAGQDGAS